MLLQTRGLVLFHFKYSETSVITRIYTEELGLQSYLVPGARKKKSKFRASLMQPFSLLDMEVYHKEKGGLQRIKEMSPQGNLGSGLMGDIVKSSIAIFLSEVIYQSIKEEEKNPSLYRFIQQSAELLHRHEGKTVNFHLWFLIAFSGFLGFQIRNNWEEGRYFDLQEGSFVIQKPIHNLFCLPEESKLLSGLLENINDPFNISLSNRERKQLLNILLDFYHLHIASFGEIKSKKVLEEVMT